MLWANHVDPWPVSKVPRPSESAAKFYLLQFSHFVIDSTGSYSPGFIYYTANIYLLCLHGGVFTSDLNGCCLCLS